MTVHIIGSIISVAVVVAVAVTVAVHIRLLLVLCVCVCFLFFTTDSQLRYYVISHFDLILYIIDILYTVL